jgi:hypothetical protein
MSPRSLWTHETGRASEEDALFPMPKNRGASIDTLANHSDPHTTKLYDRRCDEFSLDGAERILV